MHPRFIPFALFYFCYYAALGAYTPYIGRFVEAHGHGGAVVGTVLGLWYGSRIIGPPVWAWICHHSREPGYWFVAGCALTLLCFAGFVFTHEAWSLFTVMAVFGFFYNAVMPQFEGMTLAALGDNTHEYGRIRVWGSLGFLLVASSYGALLDRLGSLAFPWITLPLFLATLACAWPHRRDPAPRDQAPPAGTLLELARRPGVPRFLLIALLMQVGFGPFYVFYTLHLQAQGHGGLAIGLLWGLGVAIEIAMFWQAPKLIARYGAPRLMAQCLAVTVLRWIATALYPQSLPLMALAQATHCLGFAVFHACCMQLMAGFFRGRDGARGQSLLYGFSSGVGGVIGAVLSALLWEQGRGLASFLGGAAVTLLALLALRPRPRERVQAA
jgi:PPP family 3-phenylpropionic acid transporter